MIEQALKIKEVKQERWPGVDALLLQLSQRNQALVLAALKYVTAISVETVTDIEDVVIVRLHCEHPLEKEAVIATIMTLDGVRMALPVDAYLERVECSC